MESSHLSLGPCPSEVTHRFSSSVKSCLELRSSGQSCVRAAAKAGNGNSSNNSAVAASNFCLEADASFEIRIDKVDPLWAGSIR